MNKKIFLATVIFLFCLSCTNNDSKKQSVISKDTEDIQNETDEGDYIDEHDILLQKTDTYYKIFPEMLVKLEKLCDESHFNQALDLYHSEQVSLVKNIFQQYLSGNISAFIEFSGLSEETSNHLRKKGVEEEVQITKLGVEILENTGNDSTEEYVQLLNELSIIYMGNENYKKARETVDKTFNVTAKLFGENSSEYATVTFNKAYILKEMGQKGKALETMKKAKKIYEQAGMENSEEWQNCVDNLLEWKN
jgi:tetratricopeptide (TPR) repeat protein